MSTKIDNSVVDHRLSNRQIVRIDNYIDNKTPIIFECEVCLNRWKAAPSNIFRGRGCPICAIEKQKWSMLELNNFLLEKNRRVRLIGNYTNSQTKADFECQKCDYRWSATPNSIVSKENGCPRCAKNMPLDNYLIDERLLCSNIRRIGQYANSKTKIKLQCIDCLFIFDACIFYYLKNNGGCPNCSNKLKLTNDIIDLKLLKFNIKRVGNCAGAREKIDFICLDCENIWNGWTYSVINGKGGCPACHTSGRLEKEAKLYIGKYIKNIKFEFLYKNIFPQLKHRYKADIYLPDHKIVIEIQGRQHYEPVRFHNSCSQQKAEANFIIQQQRDLLIRNLCSSNQIKLFEIDIRKIDLEKLKKEISYVLFMECGINTNLKFKSANKGL